MNRLVVSEEATKRCSRCPGDQPLDAFPRDKTRPDGLHPYCKACIKKHRRVPTAEPVSRNGAPDGSRRCSDCKNVFPLENFTKRGYQCTDCRPAYNRRVWYRHTYGIEWEEVEALIEAQGNKCAACQDPLETFHLDHCHTSGHVRGVLCHHCNVALGHLRDEPRRIRSLLRYLEDGETNQ